MDAKDLAKILGRDEDGFRFSFYRQGKGSHEEWSNGELQVTIPMGHVGDMKLPTMNGILDDAGPNFLRNVKSVAEADIRIRDHFEQQAVLAEQERIEAERHHVDFAGMGMTPDQIALFQKIPDSMDGISISNDGVSEDLEVLSLSKQLFAEAEDEGEQQEAVNAFIQEYYAIDSAALSSLTLAVQNISQFISEDPAEEGSLTAAQRGAAADSGQTISVDKAELEITDGEPSNNQQRRAGRNNRRNNP